MPHALHLPNFRQLFLQRQACGAIQLQPRRNLNLLEYQSKSLLQDGGVAIQQFCVLDAVHRNGGAEWDKFAAPEYVVKAQILAGGRGKGHFSNGFKGGVHITKE